MGGEQNKAGQKKSEAVILKAQIHCEGCRKKLEKAVGKIRGIESFKIDKKESRVSVVGPVDAQAVLNVVRKETGKHVELLVEERPQNKPKIKTDQKSLPKDAQQEPPFPPIPPQPDLLLPFSKDDPNTCPFM